MSNKQITELEAKEGEQVLSVQRERQQGPGFYFVLFFNVSVCVCVCAHIYTKSLHVWRSENNMEGIGSLALPRGAQGSTQVVTPGEPPRPPG